jgi:hypothetical protein
MMLSRFGISRSRSQDASYTARAAEKLRRQRLATAGAEFISIDQSIDQPGRRRSAQILDHQGWLS